MAKKKVRIAIIGVGNMGSQHIGSLLANKDCELVAVCDSDPTRLEVAKARGDFALYADHKKLFKDKICDAVVIATPHYDHTTIGIEALNSGYHVLVEKPLTLNIKDAEFLHKLAKINNINLMVGHLLLFHPAIIKIKELLNAGKIGNLQYMYSNRLNLGKIREEENVFWSFAPHDISIFQYINRKNIYFSSTIRTFRRCF